MAAITGGVLSGVGARLLMRWVAETENGESAFSVVETSGIVVVFIVFTIPFAIAYVVRPRSRRLIGVLQVVGYSLLSSPQALTSEPGQGPPLPLFIGNRLLFVVVYILAAAVLGRFCAVLTRHHPSPHNVVTPREESRIGWVLRRSV
ncbi:MAG: hypothetical protein ABIM89_06850 [Mycobacteriales bacterium]